MDCTNIRYLIHTHVISEHAAETFFEISKAQPEDKRHPMIFENQSSNQTKTFIALDNTAVAAGLLRFHDQNMDGKKMKSVNVFVIDDQ